ncbi:hypothetical protein EC991_001572 [Linnemannia zychae]|nr:hypothetical protein EC991_001572 [Linnemannia zychae]
MGGGVHRGFCYRIQLASEVAGRGTGGVRVSVHEDAYSEAEKDNAAAGGQDRKVPPYKAVSDNAAAGTGYFLRLMKDLEDLGAEVGGMDGNEGHDTAGDDHGDAVENDHASGWVAPDEAVRRAGLLDSVSLVATAVAVEKKGDLEE